MWQVIKMCIPQSKLLQQNDFTVQVLQASIQFRLRAAALVCDVKSC